MGMIPRAFLYPKLLHITTATVANADMEYLDAEGILRATEYAGAGLTASTVGIFSP